MTADRTSRRGGIAPNFELAVYQVIHSLVALNHHHQIDAFDTDLQSPTAAGDGEERRCAPTARCAARRNAPAILGSENKAALQQMRHNGNALCMIQDFLRNALI